MRKTYEPLFKKYGVDVAFSGHDHAYDRSFPTFDNAPDLDCGTTHLCVGGGDHVFAKTGHAMGLSRSR